MKRNIMLIIVLIFIFILTGCTTKKEISTSKFIDIVHNYKLKSMDVSKQFVEVDNIKTATIAESDDMWQIEFYTFDGKDGAKEMYETSYNSYLTNKPWSRYADEINNKKYNEYTLVTEELYLHVCRVDDTLLYVNVPIDYKTDVEKVIRALKY